MTSPQVEVLEIVIDGDATLISVRLEGNPAPPLAPASLRFSSDSTTTLEALVSLDAHVAVFRTSEAMSQQLLGETADLQRWWTPDGYAAVTDTSRTWVNEAVSTDHEHCRLDWFKMGTSGEASWGWRSEDDWLCDACHDSYIARDLFKLRR